MDDVTYLLSFLPSFLRYELQVVLIDDNDVIVPEYTCCSL